MHSSCQLEGHRQADLASDVFPFEREVHPLGRHWIVPCDQGVELVLVQDQRLGRFLGFHCFAERFDSFENLVAFLIRHLERGHLNRRRFGVLGDEAYKLFIAVVNSVTRDADNQQENHDDAGEAAGRTTQTAALGLWFADIRAVLFFRFVHD